MSMRDYACEDYGLVLDEPTMKHICAKMWADDPVEDGDEGCALYEAEVCNLFGQFTGEAVSIRDDGTDDWSNSTTYGCDEVYYVPINKYPSLFRTAYKDMSEIVDEFKTKVGEYMPNGYDYRANIRHIIGTTFG